MSLKAGDVYRVLTDEGDLNDALDRAEKGWSDLGKPLPSIRYRLSGKAFKTMYNLSYTDTKLESDDMDGYAWFSRDTATMSHRSEHPYENSFLVPENDSYVTSQATELSYLSGETTRNQGRPWTLRRAAEVERERFQRFLNRRKQLFSLFLQRQNRLRSLFYLRIRRKLAVLQLRLSNLGVKAAFDVATSKITLIASDGEIPKKAQGLLERCRELLQQQFVAKKFKFKPYVPRYFDLRTGRALVPVTNEPLPVKFHPVFHQKWSAGRLYGSMAMSYQKLYLWQGVQYGMAERYESSRNMEISYKFNLPYGFGWPYADGFAQSRNYHGYPAEQRSWNVTPPDPQYLEPPLSEEDLIQLVDRVVPHVPVQANLLEDLGELLDTIRSVANIVRGIHRLYRTLRLIDTETIARYVRGYRRNPTRALTDLNWILKTGTGASLFTKFGALPVVQSIQTLISAACGKLEPVYRETRKLLQSQGKLTTIHRVISKTSSGERLEAGVIPGPYVTGSSTHTSDWEEPTTSEFTTLAPFWGTNDAADIDTRASFSKITTVRDIARLTVQCTPVCIDERGRLVTDADSIAWRMLLTSLGLYWKPSVLWDLMPLSFAVDWFTDLPSLVVKRLDRPWITILPSVSGICVTRKRVTTTTIRMGTPPPINSSSSESYDDDEMDEHYTVTRKEQKTFNGAVRSSPSRLERFQRWTYEPSLLGSAGYTLIRMPTAWQAWTGVELVAQRVLPSGRQLNHFINARMRRR